jgi:hypothetical protein
MAYTIKIKKYSDHIEEIAAGGTITPGHLIAEGSAGTVVVHASAGQNAIPMFALEDELQGKAITDNYASGDQVQCWIPYRGDQVYAILADGEDIAIGDLLESAGDGTLQKHVASSAGAVEYPLAVVAQATEAVDMSGSAGEDPDGRIIVRIV